MSVRYLPPLQRGFLATKVTSLAQSSCLDQTGSSFVYNNTSSECEAGMEKEMFLISTIHAAAVF